MVSLLSQMNSVDILTFSLFMISFNNYLFQVVCLLHFFSTKSLMLSLLHHASHMRRWAHLHPFNHPNNNRWWEESMKLFIPYFHPTFCHIPPLRSKCFCQYQCPVRPVSTRTFLPQNERPSCTPIRKEKTIYIYLYFNSWNFNWNKKW